MDILINNQKIIQKSIFDNDYDYSKEILPIEIIKKYNLIHLSTGDLLRSEIIAGTKLGLEAKNLMDKGNLVPDNVVIGMISSKLDNNSAYGYIFDGFPRTTQQAEALDNLLKEKNTSINIMLSLKVQDQELIKRLLNRGKDSGRSDDQDELIIKNRIKEYNNKTAPLKNYYSKQNKLNEIDGVGSIDEIAEKLYKAVDKYK